MTNYLGLDYGDKYLGLGLAIGPLAEPLQTILTASAFDIIPTIISTHRIQAIVIGISEGQMAAKTRSFAAKIQKLTNLPVFYQDETLTSYETRLRTAQAGKKKSAREGKIDHLVAAAILQDYLDSKREPNLLQ